MDTIEAQKAYRENQMRDMLAKGDVLRPAYKDFDYSNLDQSQHDWMRRLSIFTQYRKTLTKRWE